MNSIPAAVVAFCTVFVGSTFVFFRFVHGYCVAKSTQRPSTSAGMQYILDTIRAISTHKIPKVISSLEIFLR